MIDLDINMTSVRLKAVPVLVIWEDAAHQFGWLDGEEVAVIDGLVETVGWLIDRNDRHLIVVQSLTSGSHAQTLQIPAGMIRSMAFLEAI
jgi:hypothetical protein